MNIIDTMIQGRNYNLYSCTHGYSSRKKNEVLSSEKT